MQISPRARGILYVYVGVMPFKEKVKFYMFIYITSIDPY